MIKEKLYDFTEIDLVDYSFDLCENKDEFLKLLKTSTPQKTDKFNSKGTTWNLCDIDDCYGFVVNGGQIFITTMSDSINGLLDFLINLAYYDKKDLILGFDDEGSSSAITALAIDDSHIRFTVFDYGLMEHKKILSDIIINKKTFIQQFYEILNKLYADILKETYNRSEYTAKKLKKCLDSLTQYLDNETEFKNTYDIETHMRVFDIAYKDLNCDWKFEICFADEEKADQNYWEKLKQEGKILDYDYLEQSPTDGYTCYNHETKTRKRLYGEELRQSIKPNMEERVNNRNWVYSTLTNKWYSYDEEMTEPTINYGIINEVCKYDINIDTELYPKNEDEQLKFYIENSYDENGKLHKDEDFWGYLKCWLTITNNSPSKFCEIEFDYRNNRRIRTALEKAKNGEYVRFDLGGYKQNKMHIWQKISDNKFSKSDEYLAVGCYEKSEDYMHDKEIYYFFVRKEFIDCFLQALDDIEYKINVTKRTMKSAEKLKIDKKFELSSSYDDKLEYAENFVGDYACVYKGSLNGWGIVNKNMEWVIKPEYATVCGEEHPKYGKMIKGFYTKYSYLHNINGKLFIAAKQDEKQFVIDINGNIQIPHVSDKIYYTNLNNELWFIAVDYDKTYIVNSKGEDILTLDFPIGENFWLFKNIIIISKDNKYGIIDWKGNVKIDFIFSEIKPDKDNLDFIPVKYMDKWGFITKSGKIINMKIKEQSETDEKCSKVDL